MLMPLTEPMADQSMHGVTPGNTDNLFTMRLLTSVAEEPTLFMTNGGIEAILKKEKEKASVSSKDL